MSAAVLSPQLSILVRRQRGLWLENYDFSFFFFYALEAAVYVILPPPAGLEYGPQRVYVCYDNTTIDSVLVLMKTHFFLCFGTKFSEVHFSFIQHL